jgi:hypothetical protein
MLNLPEIKIEHDKFAFLACFKLKGSGMLVQYAN